MNVTNNFIKTSLFFLLFTFSLLGCKNYIQVFETKSNDIKVENKFYVFENDSLKITYNFWSNKGLMTFSVFNKLDKPIYIDWKKSSYIDNSVKLNYWIDEEKTKSKEYYGNYYYDGLRYAVSKSETAVKLERVTFIPPSSNYSRSQFFIFPIKFYDLDTGIEPKEINRLDNPKYKTEVYEQHFSKKNSPLIFRNFLTFSYTESFESEFYVDNEFYISKIREMEREGFLTFVPGSNFENRFTSPDENGTIFYIEIPKEKSIKNRM